MIYMTSKTSFPYKVPDIVAKKKNIPAYKLNIILLCTAKTTFYQSLLQNSICKLRGKAEKDNTSNIIKYIQID